jgi:hypothetical protein
VREPRDFINLRSIEFRDYFANPHHLIFLVHNLANDQFDTREASLVSLELDVPAPNLEDSTVLLEFLLRGLDV